MLHAIKVAQGTPFVILHGFLGMSDNWKSVANQLEKFYEVHALDLRNHGKSFHSDEFTYDLMVSDVKKYIEFHHLKSVVLLGHSMGGKVAMQLACEYPDLIEKLIIADIGTKFYPPHHLQILEGLQAVDFSVQTNRADVEETLSRFIPEIGVRQFLMKNLYWATQNQLAYRFNLNSLVKNVNEVGKKLSDNLFYHKPSLFLRGEKSNYIKDEDWGEIQSHFSQAKLVTIPQAGHWLHAEQPKLFNEQVLNFLNN